MSRLATAALAVLLGTPTFAVLLASSALAEVPATAERTASAGAAERSVRPGVNDSYRSPSLDVRDLDSGFSAETREAFAARHAVTKALRLAPGDRIADIGAGTGIYVEPFAKTVGPTGRVYAVDIAPRLLEWIAARADAAGLANVETVLGGDRTTNLPTGALDVVFSSDTYHHFEFPRTLVRDFARALKADGKMYVLDFERIEGKSSAFTLSHVRAGKQTVIREIESAGFEFVREIDLPELEQNYLLEFRKR